jgi:hypothetical protein
MLIDVSFFQELYSAEQINDYDELMNYMSKFNFSFYENNHIYIESHLYNEIILYLPITIHFKAHILLARINKGQEKIRNYSTAIQIYNKKGIFKNLFQSEYQEALPYYHKYSKETYDNQHGISIAKNRKEKLSISMSKIPEDIIHNRNKAISQGKMKKVYHVESGTIFKNAKEASLKLRININNIRKCCRKEIDNFHQNTFTYL